MALALLRPVLLLGAAACLCATIGHLAATSESHIWSTAALTTATKAAAALSRSAAPPAGGPAPGALHVAPLRPVSAAPSPALDAPDSPAGALGPLVGVVGLVVALANWLAGRRAPQPFDVEALSGPLRMATIAAGVEVTPLEAVPLFRKQGYTIVDLRSPMEVARGSLGTNAVEIPMFDAYVLYNPSTGGGVVVQEANADWLQRVKERFARTDKLLLMCSDGSNRSRQALELLRNSQFTDVSVIAGGFNRWDQDLDRLCLLRPLAARAARAGLRDPIRWRDWASAVEAIEGPTETDVDIASVSQMLPEAPAASEGATAASDAPASPAPSAPAEAAAASEPVPVAPPAPAPAAPAAPAASPLNEGYRLQQRVVYSPERWRRHRSLDRYGRSIQTIAQSSILLNTLLSAVSGITLVTAIVCALHTLYPEEMIRLPTFMFSSAAPVLGLLLVFRTNASYERWDGARKLIGLVKNRSEDITRQISSRFPADRPDLKEQMLRYLQSFFFALKVHLRMGPKGWEDDTQLVADLTPILRPNELELLLKAFNRPAHTLHCMGQIAKEAKIDGGALFCLDQNLTTLADVLGGCERIRGTPIPLSYTRMTTRFIVVFLLLLPLAMAPEVLKLGVSVWYTIPAMLVISFLLLGVEEVGVQIEEPFTVLPMEAYAEGSRKNTSGIYQMLSQTVGIVEK